MRVIKAIAWALVWLVLFVAALWAAGALYFDFPVSDLGGPAAVLFALALLATVIFVRGKLLKLTICLGGFALVTGWWLTLSPTNDSDWQPDVARTRGPTFKATK